MNYKDLIKYYFKKKNYSYNEKEFEIIHRGYKEDAKNILKLTSPEKAKKAINIIKNWAESRDLNWSLSTVLKKWGELDKLKPQQKKKKPYFRGDPMKKKGDKWYVMPSDGGDWLEFAGNDEDIEWK